VRDETTGFLKLIWGKREGNYFCSGGWTWQIALIRFNKSQLSSDRRQSSVIALIAALSGALGDLSRPCSHRSWTLVVVLRLQPRSRIRARIA
jgi:hypothetical protein